MSLKAVNPEMFQCVETGLLDNLGQFSEADFRPFLPILVRSSLIQAGDICGKPIEFRQKILVALSDIEAVNSLVALLSVDFQVLEGDVKKELQLRQKFGNRDQDSVLVQSLKDGLAMEYERSDATRRLRLVLSETLYVMSQIHETRPEYYMKSSDLFDNWVYLEEMCDTINIALVELPNILFLSEVCEAMLHVRHGPWIISRLVANMPDSFLEVCFHLISNGDKCEEESEGGLIRLEALKVLCSMNPKQRLLIRSRCVEQCRMPALSIFLSLECEDIEVNLIPFLSGILLGNDQQIRNWFTVYVRNGQKRKSDSLNSVLRMREAIWTYLKKTLNETRHKSLKEYTVVQASSFLRLACALKGIAGFKFYDDEIGDLVRLITLKAPNSPPGYRFITLGLCTLLALPSLLSTAEHEKIIIEWIKSLLEEEMCISTCGVNSSFGEILLLMAIHFHSNQLSAIAELVCATLGMKIAIRINTMTRIKQIFTQDIFTEQVVTAHAIRVPVTSGLSGDIAGFLPVHCIYQLIKSRAFTKHRVPIKDWIYRQLLSTKLPLHPVLPALLEVYTNSVLVPGTGIVGGAKIFIELTNEPLTDEEVLDVFHDFQAKNLAPQLLILYYLLLYEDSRQINCRNLVALGKKVKLYSGKLFSQIPIKFLLQEAQKSQHQCGGLFPSLLKLLTTHFPQLCIVNEWVEESVMLSKGDAELQLCIRRNSCVSISEGSLRNAFSNCTEVPGDAIKLLETCMTLQPHKLWPHAKEIVEQVKTVIHSNVPRKIQDLFRDVWYQLNNVFPRHLWEMTSNALLPHNSVYLNVEELTIDPIQILKCNPKVFRCAPVLNILLHILAASLASSKYFLTKHLIENPVATTFGGNNEFEREELKMALVAVQDSATVQILLEACLPTDEEKLQEGIANDLCLKEIQSLICSFLHQMFIADPNLAKLVHFQGYPLELLEVTVRGIPSMHICSDFIPELLNQPETSKQVFAVQLISHLSMQYALPKSFSIARLALATMNSMASGVVSEERAEFFIPALSALERLSEAFPPLIDDIVTLLMHLGKICTAQNSVERNRMCKIVRNKFLLTRVYETYDAILKHSMLDRKLF